MLTIGRFADTTGLTVKALRHYDEIGLLVPARVDEDNGYRYYDTAQVEDAVTIRRLRALELPLDEIRELLAADGDTFRDRLAAHGYRVGEEFRDKHSLVLELSALVEGGDEAIAIEIEIRDIPELRLAGTIRHLQLVDPAGVEEMLQLAAGRLAERGIEPAGPATAVFRGGDGDGTHLVEAGFPVAEGVGGDDLLRLKTYPAAPAATADHVGSYDRLPVTSQRFIATVLGQGLRFGQGIRIEFVERDARARLVWPLATEEGRRDDEGP
jgi:DNA-binding transcriptional MerR regulator